MIATFSLSKIKLWDLKKYEKPLFTIQTSSVKGVKQISWSPLRSGLLASIGNDENLIRLYDLKDFSSLSSNNNNTNNSNTNQLFPNNNSLASNNNIDSSIEALFTNPTLSSPSSTLHSSTNSTTSPPPSSSSHQHTTSNPPTFEHSLSSNNVLLSLHNPSLSTGGAGGERDKLEGTGVNREGGEENKSLFNFNRPIKTHQTKFNLDSFSWHPKLALKLISMGGNGMVEMFSLNESIPLAFSPKNSNLLFAYGKHFYESSLPPSHLPPAFSFHSNFIRRTSSGYSLDVTIFLYSFFFFILFSLFFYLVFIFVFFYIIFIFILQNLFLYFIFIFI